MLPETTSCSPTRSLHLYGWEHLDLTVIAALLANVPILLVGDIGAGKTDGAEAIARAIFGDSTKWAVYEAPNIQIDDLVGFPDVASLARGEATFVGLPMSVWNVNAVVIDEITRANPTAASKFLEIVRSKKVYGIPTAIRLVFATANPQSRKNPNVHKLDAALASRFAIVNVPDFAELSEADVRAVGATTLGGTWPWYPLPFTPEPVETVLSIRKLCAQHNAHLSGRQFRHLQAMLGAAAAARSVCTYTADTLTTLTLSCIPEASAICVTSTDTSKLETALLSFFGEYLRTELPPVTDWPAYYSTVASRAVACSSKEQAAVLRSQIPTLAKAAIGHAEDVQALMVAIAPLLLRYPSDDIAASPVMPLNDLLRAVLT